MIALHVHWHPPQSPDEIGGVFFWGETSRTSIPASHRGKIPLPVPPCDHPFAAKVKVLQRILGYAPPDQLVLPLPSNHGGPQPSPDLVIDWQGKCPNKSARSSPPQVSACSPVVETT